jgi:glycosyltransferase involved in cell wall biosynthesis
MPLRILNVVRFPIGGIRSFLRYTYSRLPPEDYSTTIVTVDVPEAKLLPSGLSPLAVDLRLVPEDRAVLRLAFEMNRTLRTGGYELVHSHGTTAALASWPGARWSGLPHVVTLHETFREDQFIGTAGRIKRLVLQRLFGDVDAVVTVTNDARENLLEHVPLDSDAKRRLHVIRNGVAIDTLVAEAAAMPPGLRANRTVDATAILLGYVGRFMPEKGFDVLLEAVRLLHQRAQGLPRFVVVAMNDGAYIREYRQQISEWGLDSYFTFMGRQSSAAGMLMEIDALVVPSRREACGLVAMEAMVLGCPLISSDCLGLRELTIGSPALTATAGDSASLASVIETFLRSRAEASERARAYIPVARTAFDASLTTASLIALFNNVIATRLSGIAVAATPRL